MRLARILLSPFAETGHLSSGCSRAKKSEYDKLKFVATPKWRNILDAGHCFLQRSQ
jgi:hypothetical protein